MTQQYIINLTDPFKDDASFSVKEFTTNGPLFPISSQLNNTAVDSNTSLILYGKGVPNYGERIQENMVHILENFAGSTQPSNPITGQLWFARYNHIKIGLAWYKWDGASWVTIVPASGTPTTLIDESYHTAIVGVDTLLRQGLDKAEHPMSPTYITHEYLDLTGIVANPNAENYVMDVELKVFDGNSWKSVNAGVTHVDDYAPQPTLGGLWYDLSETTANKLKVFNGSVWVAVTDGFLELTGGTLDGNVVFNTGSLTMTSGNIDLGNNTITSLSDPVELTDAANRNWVETHVTAAVAAGALTITFDNLTDVDLTGASEGDLLRRNVSGDWIPSTATFADIAGTGITASLAEINYSDGVTSNIQTQINSKMGYTGGSFTGLVYSNTTLTQITDDTQLVTKEYVDSQVVSAPDDNTFISGASLAAATGVLTITRNDAVTYQVSGLLTTSTPLALTYTPTEGLLLDANGVSNLPEAIAALDENAHETNNIYRSVEVVATPQQTFDTPGYIVGKNQLSVYVNGIKQIANTRGRSSWDIGSVTYSTPTPLSTAITYTCNVNVDGGGNLLVSVDGTNASTYGSFVKELNLALDAASVLGYATLEHTGTTSQIVIHTDADGTGTSVIVSNTGINPLLTALGTTSVSTSGITFAYGESFGFGLVSNSISFDTIVTSGSALEFISTGFTGT